jgi:hypothetical protein
MSIAVVVVGAQLVRSTISGTAADLGYTANGVQVTVEGFTKNVPSDDRGGDDGIPTDIQDLGEIHRIRCEMTKYDAAQALLLEGRLKGSSSGSAKTVGTLVFAGTKYFSLILATSAGVAIRTYTCASIVRTPQDVNKGSIFSRHAFEFECFPDPITGKLFSEAI